MFSFMFVGCCLWAALDGPRALAPDAPQPVAAFEMQDAPPPAPPAQPARPGPRPAPPRAARPGDRAPRPDAPQPPATPAPPARARVPVADELWRALLGVMDDRRPDLAERLRELRENDPQRANEVLHEALVLRIEQALDGPADPDRRPMAPRPPGPPRGLDGPRGPRPPRPPPPPDADFPGAPGMPGEPGSPGAPRPPRPPRIEADPRARELQQQQSEADRQSRELAEQLRRGAGDLSPAQREALRGDLHAAVEQQFELRSQLRAFELERIREDAERIQRRLDAVQAELDRRTAERAAIIERRMQELLNRAEDGE